MRLEKRQDIKYFIEDAETRLWFSSKEHRSGFMLYEWSSNPNKAIKFDFKEEAQDYMALNPSYFSNRKINITEHIFI